MIATRLLTIALVSISVASACECTEPSVEDAKQAADIVFRGYIRALRPTGKRPRLVGGGGKITFFDTGKIAVFRVTHTWKGKLGQTFEMPAAEDAGGCWGFKPAFLRLGSDLIVYATRQPDGEYYTGICTRTRFSKDAIELEDLGQGEPNSK
jgi:hypothetical protein